MLDPAGPAARDISTLWWVMLGGAVAILVFLTVLLSFAFRVPSAPPDDAQLERIWIVGLGLGFSIAVLASLLAYGIATGARLTAPPTNPVKIAARATLGGWTFRYGDAPGAETVGVLHIPADRDIAVELTSGDVIHSFWVPRLAGKIDAIPGHINTLHIRADAPGLYQGLSAEYSGPGYSDHRFEVRVHDETAWQNFLQRGEP